MRSSRLAVCDASGLIALNRIGRLGLIADLFGRVLIPPAVRRELQSVNPPAWIEVQHLPEIVEPPDSYLGAGEMEAIQLAVMVQADQVILDDLDARRMAARRGLRVVGTLGLLLEAKELGFLATVRPEMDRLRAGSFHISPRLYQAVLRQAGEE